MRSEILIKYDIDGNFIENQFYNIDFIYDKSSSILTLELSKGNDAIKSDIFLREIDGKLVPMEFRGISKIDGLKLFVLNSSNIRRDYKLSELFK